MKMTTQVRKSSKMCSHLDRILLKRSHFPQCKAFDLQGCNVIFRLWKHCFSNVEIPIDVELEIHIKHTFWWMGVGENRTRPRSSIYSLDLITSCNGLLLSTDSIQFILEDFQWYKLWMMIATINSQLHEQAPPPCLCASCAWQCVSRNSCQYFLDVFNLKWTKSG